MNTARIVVLKLEDMQSQTCPAATASAAFTRHYERPDADGSALMAAIPPSGVDQDEPARRRGENVSVIRLGIPSQTTAQK